MWHRHSCLCPVAQPRLWRGALDETEWQEITACGRFHSYREKCRLDTDHARRSAQTTDNAAKPQTTRYALHVNPIRMHERRVRRLVVPLIRARAEVIALGMRQVLRQ